jgi:hypothetical protein
MATDKTQGCRRGRGATSRPPPRPPGQACCSRRRWTSSRILRRSPCSLTCRASRRGQLTSTCEGVLTIPGHAAAPERPNEVAVLGEYRTGAPFQRSLTVSEAIDQGRIRATLMQGVLRLRLPKTERAKPRQITIQTE